jgi:peptide-methionine (R)-S-oxide reductase
MKLPSALFLLIATSLTLTLTACAQDMQSTAKRPNLKSKYDLSGYPKVSDKVRKSDEEWRAQLTPEQYRILRTSGTELACSGKLLNNKEKGVYVCAACGNPLFSSEFKFESGTGWPSFYAEIEQGRVSEHVDRSWGMVRTEINCARCDSHLGHVFDDGPDPTGLRYCTNSESLKFEKKE